MRSTVPPARVAVGFPLLALASDARTIEQSSRWWPRRKAPRPEKAIKTRAAVGPCVFEVFHIARAEVKWRTASEEWRPPPCEHVCPCSPRSSAANKPKALSAAHGDWDIFDVLQSHILPCPTASTSVKETEHHATSRNGAQQKDRSCNRSRVPRNVVQGRATPRNAQVDFYRRGPQTEIPVT